MSPVRGADCGDETTPFGAGADADRDPSIVVSVEWAAFVNAVRRCGTFLRIVAGHRLRAAVSRDVEQRGADYARDGLELRQIDELSVARAASMP